MTLAGPPFVTLSLSKGDRKEESPRPPCKGGKTKKEEGENPLLSILEMIEQFNKAD
jgi:hypothetical protein